MDASTRLPNRKLGWALAFLSAALLSAEILRRQAARWPADEAPGASTTVLALDMDKPSGFHRNEQAVELWSNGSLFFDATLPPGGGRLWVESRGTAAAGRGPRLSVLQDGTAASAVEVGPAWGQSVFPLPFAGLSRIELRYDNDTVLQGEDRNLEIRRAVLEPAGTGWSGAELLEWRDRLPVAPLLLASFCCLGLSLALLADGGAQIAVILLLCATAQGLSAGRGPWEADEFLFSGAILDYDVTGNSPQPPGCPAWIGLGKLVTALFGCAPHRALMGLSLVFSILLALPMHRIALRLTGSTLAASGAALLYQFFPAVWIHSSRAFDCGPSLFFLLAAIAAALEGRAAAGVLFGICVGIRPQMAPIALTAMVLMGRVGSTGNKGTAGRAPAVRGFLLFGLTCAAWIVPVLWDTGIHEYIAALHVKGGQTLQLGLRLGGLPVSLLEGLWGGKACPLVLYPLAVFGGVCLALRRPREALALAALGAVAAVWLLGYHGPLVRYRLPLLAVLAILVAAGLAELTRRRPAAFLALLMPLLAWLATIPQAALAILATEAPPPAAFLDRIQRGAGRDAFYVFAQPLWSVIRYGRLRDPGFPDAREEGRLEALPPDKPVFVLEDLTDQLCSRPEGTFAGWEWNEPVLDALDQGRFSRLFLRRAEEAVYGKGWWSTEGLGTDLWRWMGPEATVYLAPAPQGGELTLAFESPEALLAQAPSVELAVASGASESAVDRFSPSRFEARSYHLAPGPAHAAGWTKLLIRVTGARLDPLHWDGRHRGGTPFHLVLRVHELRWKPGPPGGSATRTRQAPQARGASAP